MSESGAEYVKRKMKNRNPNKISTFKKLQRAQRKARLIDAGVMDADDTFIEQRNLELFDADDGKRFRRHLHPTKGIRTRSELRDLLIGLDRAGMWKLTTQCLQLHCKGKIKKDQHGTVIE